MPTGASVVMINIFAFLLFWTLHIFSKEKRTMKKSSSTTLTCAISLLCMLLITGCNDAKTGAVQKNSAGTLSVSIPALVTENASATNTVIDTDEVSVRSGSKSGESAAPVIEIKEKMFIAQVNEIYLNPEDYLGKAIKLEGLFKSEQYIGSAVPYCFVIRYGPGCCGNDGNAGFEVAWEIQDTDATPYPAPDEWVEAIGTLKSYDEDGYPYLYLALSQLNVLDAHGAEFVTQ
jgi:uncharacterized membrane protein YcgQ (UPF0703/DUF1980 family)